MAEAALPPAAWRGHARGFPFRSPSSTKRALFGEKLWMSCWSRSGGGREARRGEDGRQRSLGPRETTQDHDAREEE